MKHPPVFVTGVERSGSSLIARIFQICGVVTGVTNNMLENLELKELCNKYLAYNALNGELISDTQNLKIPVDWKQTVESRWDCECTKDQMWMFKSSLLTQMWPVWYYAYPNARWIIVRRKPTDIVQSCVKTGFMKMFKESQNLEKIGVTMEEEGWKWWIRQYEKKFVEMIEIGVNCKQVWPERMVAGDYHQIYETLEWLGLRWNTKIVETIDPMLNKSRRKEEWHT